MDGTYGFGPFIINDDRAHTVLVEGRRCVIEVTPRIIPSWLCGYVAVPRSKVPEKWIENYYDIPVDVHGGVTYLEVFGKYVVIGFDCAHAGDEDRPNLHVPQHVMVMVRDLEDQLIRLGVF